MKRLNTRRQNEALAYARAIKAEKRKARAERELPPHLFFVEEKKDWENNL